VSEPIKKPVVLRVYKDDQLVFVKQFMDSQIVFGRQGDVQVPLEGENVSIIHASIEERDNGYYIADLGSETGTLRNGETVLDTPIESGDTLQIGDYRIEFFIGAPKPKAAPAPSSTVVSPAVASAPAPTPTPAPPIAKAPPAPVSAPPAAPKATPPAFTPPPVAAATAPVEKPKAAAPKTPATPPPTVSGTNLNLPPSGGFAQASAGVAAASSEVKPVQKTPSPVTPKTKSAGADTEITRPTSSMGPVPTGGTKVSARPAQNTFGRHQSSTSTFAPASRFNNVNDYIKPSKGTVVEVLVAWGERVISSYHFSKGGTITMGSSEGCDIHLPIVGGKAKKIPVLKIDARAMVLVSPEMTGELVHGNSSMSFAELLRLNRLTKAGAQYTIALEQGELVKLDVNDKISVLVRYVPESPKPLMAPLIDLTTSEAVGVIMAIAVMCVLGLYMFLYTPPKPLGDEKNDEPMRMALIVVKPPPMPKPKPEPTPEATPPPTPPPVVKSTPSPKKQTTAPAQHKAENIAAKKDPGAASNVAPNKNKTGPTRLTSVKQGGAVKTTDKPAAQMQSPKKDVTKSGMFSVFGKGANNEIAQSYSGSGELIGTAEAASGKAGMNENREGQGLGSAMKDTGKGGTGTAQMGVSGVQTKGRGSGYSGFGTGGLGDRSGVKIVPGGAEENYGGSIDREAIRRVIQANLRVIQSCYERELNRHPDLLGKVIIEWDIGEKGRVMRAHVKSSELGNTSVGQCLIDRLKTWTFPEPPTNNEVTVAYPFFFSS
jgi:outer membrane biosynthesis protein TonB